jgi:hypothetical protein
MISENEHIYRTRMVFFSAKLRDSGIEGLDRQNTFNS